jgi:hypothetical protein
MANDGRSTRQIKAALLAALSLRLGIVSPACNDVGVSRKTFYKYYNHDAKFRQAVDDLGEVALDFAEAKIFAAMDAGDWRAAAFVLRTRGRKRGYAEHYDALQEGAEVDIEPVVILPPQEPYLLTE